VPIPFTDVEEVAGLGSAAYLKVESSRDGACAHGGLFVMTARGEPLEFGYNRVRVPQPFLWREADLERHVQRRLTASLLSVCSQQPRILLCLAGEVGIWLFGKDLQVEVPVARLAPPTPARRVDHTTGEVLEDDDRPLANVSWQPEAPDAGSLERDLFDHLATHGLLLEPFERAAAGLREVYGSVTRSASP